MSATADRKGDRTHEVHSKDGTPIAFDRLGEGPPIILVDGALSYRAFGPMGPLAQLLARRFTVFTYDRRGRGQSGDSAPYAVQREVDDLEALIAEAGGAVFLYGTSSGAALALEAAARGLRIRKLALHEPPFDADDNARPAFGEYKKQLSSLISEGRRGDAVALFLRDMMPVEALNEMRTAPTWSIFEAVAPTLVYDNAIMGDGSVPTKRASSVTVPTLVLDGGESPPFMRDAAQVLAKAMPDAQYRTLAGQSHQVAPEVLAPVLVEFFSD